MDFLIYSYVKDIAGESGTCWQSLAKIGRAVGKNRRTVQRSIRTLVRYGYLEEEQRDGRTTNLRLVDVWAANAAARGKGLDTRVQGTGDTDVWAARTCASTDQKPGSEISSGTRSQNLSRATARDGRIEEALSLALPVFAAIDPSRCSQGVVRTKLTEFLSLTSGDPLTVMTDVLLPEFEWSARRRSVTRLDDRNHKRVEPVLNRIGYMLAALDGTRIRDVCGIRD